MIKKVEVEKFLMDHKKLSSNRKISLLAEIGSSNNPKEEVKSRGGNPTKRGVSEKPKREPLNVFPGHEHDPIGTILRRTDTGQIYKKGRSWWTPVKK